jgi:Uma2 family endonuclease
MAKPAARLVTVDEFLRWDSGDDRRYQLIRGAIVMMAPPARRHGVLASRVDHALRRRLTPPCEPQTEAGILLEGRPYDFYVTDLAVSCSPLGDERWCPEPLVVVEVLSPSTEDEVRHEKLPNYRQIASLRDILLVASDAVLVEHWRRPGAAWSRELRRAGDSLKLAGVAIEIPVDEIYAGLGL